MTALVVIPAEKRGQLENHLHHFSFYPVHLKLYQYNMNSVGTV